MRTGLVSVVIRELRRICSEPSYFIIIIVTPFLIFFLFASMFSKGVIRNIPVAVVDRDNSAMSREIIRKIDSMPSVRITGILTNLEEGRVSLVRGGIYSLIYIQNGFESKTERGIPCNIINYYNNENLLISGTVVRDITAVISNFSSEKFAENLSKKGMLQPQIKSMTEPVTVSTHVLFNPYLNYMYYLLSGLLPNALHFFILLTSIYAIGIEMKKGTMAELMETGGMNTAVAITGKLIPYTLIYSVIGMFMLGLMFRYLQFPVKGNLFLVVISTLFFVVSYQAVGIVFIALTGNLTKAMLASSFYASSAFTFSGVTFPVITMYGPAKIWSYCLPITHYLDVIVEQAFRGSPLNISVRSMFYMILFLLLPVMLYPRLKTLLSGAGGNG